MLKTIHATFDGTALYPEEPVDLEPGTYMRITIEILKPTKAKTGSFLQTARSLKLEGPSDWSTNLEDYLYEPKSERSDD
ncbi:MAG: hypothetical protein U9N43_00985 [Euryarchaeota archaeon]|nr:hypothetical protein [Euryarchaeota archaeon]